MRKQHWLGLAIAALLLVPDPTVAAEPKSELEAATETLKTSKDPQVRLEAVQKLMELKDPESIPILVESLKSVAENPADDWFVAGAAMKALLKIGKPSIQPLRGVLDDPDHRVRRRALDTLCRLKAADRMDLLERFLTTDPNFEVRLACVFQLRDIGDEEAIALLRKAAKEDKNAEVREKAGKIAKKLEGKQ